jgi:hypothetical protein
VPIGEPKSLRLENSSLAVFFKIHFGPKGICLNWDSVAHEHYKLDNGVGMGLQTALTMRTLLILLNEARRSRVHGGYTERVQMLYSTASFDNPSTSGL